MRQLVELADQLQSLIAPSCPLEEVPHLAGDTICCVTVELIRQDLHWRTSPGSYDPMGGGMVSSRRREDLCRHLVRLAHPLWEDALRIALRIAGWDSHTNAEPSVSLMRHEPADILAEVRAVAEEIATEWAEDAQSDELYEQFLAARDSKTRGRHGVYYTPPVLAEFLVDQTHQNLLKIGLPDGLLDTTTWSQWSARRDVQPPHDARPDDPIVQLVDPAAGSGVFLSAVIRVARRIFEASKKPTQDAWQRMVDQLLSRMGGNEVMPTAAAVGQLRVVWQLLETGYQLHAGTSLDWVVLDTLAEPSPAATRHRGPATVIIGNPPFRGAAPLQGSWIERLVRGQDAHDQKSHDNRFEISTPAAASYFEVDGKTLGERKVWLHDAYIRFLRWAHWQAESSGVGVVSLVLNHGLLDNVTFRGVREKLLKAFDHIDIADLHGSTKARETTPEGGRDENIFSIATGVAAICLTRHGRPTARPQESNGPPKGLTNHRTSDSPTKHGVVRRIDLWGSRSEKLSQLQRWQCEAPAWRTIECRSPEYLYVEDDRRVEPVYQLAPSLTELMPVNSTAPVTARDRFIIDRCRHRLERRLEEFADLSIADDVIRSRYFQRGRSAKYAAGDTRGWRLHEARHRLAATKHWREHIRPCLYRPFDWRFILWLDWMIDWPRPQVSRHLLQLEGNVALIARRQMLPTRPCDYFWVTRHIAMDGVIRSDNRGSESLFPLWLADSSGRCANFDNDWKIRFAAAANLTWQDEVGDASKTAAIAPRRHSEGESLSLRGACGICGPADLFAYVYGVFHAPEFRERFAGYLRRDFPRIPLPNGPEMFAKLSQVGRELIELHTQGRPNNQKSDQQAALLVATENGHEVTLGSNSVHVPKPIWDFQVGGHQAVPKWIRERKDATTNDDLVELHRMVEAIDGTLALVSHDLADVRFEHTPIF